MNCCRTCMSTKSLNPIFQYADKSMKYTDILAMTTGLKILINDSLPQVMCTNCVNFVNKYLDFREICQRSHRMLMSCINNVNVVNDNMAVKSEIEKDSSTVIVEIKNEKDDDDDYDVNNDNCDTVINHSHCKVEKVNVKSKESIEYDMTIEDLLKMKVGITFNNPKKFKKVKLKPKDVNVRRKLAERDIKDKRKRDLEMISKSLLEDSTDTVKSSDLEEKNKEVEYKDKVDERDVQEKSKEVEDKVDENDVEDKSKDEKDSSDAKVKCKYCHKVFKCLRTLKVHYKIHTGRNYVCEHCGKKFSDKKHLITHCKSRHGYEKTDKCSYCDYRGCTPYSVKVHERLHTGEKPYVCQKCGASFHRSSSYLQHIAIHLPEKTVQCDLCPSRFKSVTLMRIHKNRRHRAPQYTYKCRVCNSSFARRCNVGRHFQRIHGMEAKDQDIDRIKICRI